MHSQIEVAVPARLLAQLQEEIRLQRARLTALETSVHEWRVRALEAEARVPELEAENRELKRRLVFYENPHTPPSQRNLKRRPAARQGTGKRGAPEGHRGATRQDPEPEETIPVTLTQCPTHGCGQALGEPDRIEKRVVTERVPATTRTVEFLVGHYTCPSGHASQAAHRDLPKQGRWGPRLLTEMAMLKHGMRGTLGRSRVHLENSMGFPITRKGLWDALMRVARSCKTEYAHRVEEIRAAPFRHIDETTMKVNGKNWYLWLFRTPTACLLIIRPTRGRHVIREVLGDEPGPCVVDGYSAYEFIRTLQRCWAHLLREVDQARQASKEGAALAQAVHGIFDRLKANLPKGPPGPAERDAKEALDADLSAIVDRYQGVESVAKAVTYLKRGLASWTTCLLYEGMPPTNNAAEQGLREHVIVRRIIGTFRSEEGAQNYQFLATLVDTWRFQDRNPYEELEALLRRELCGDDPSPPDPPT